MENVTKVSDPVHTSKTPADSSEDLQVSMAQIAKAVAYAAIMVLSICGNTLVLIVVKKNIGGQMRSVRNYLLTSMAATDLLITIGSMPERLTRVLTNDEWLIDGAMGTALCKVTNFFEKLALSVSIVNLALVAVDRFLAVMFPHKKYFTRRKAFTAIASVWLTSALYCSPVLYYGGLLKKQGKTLCKVRQFFPNWKAWYLLYLAELFLTLLLVLSLYTSILCKLWRRQPPNRIGMAREDSLRDNCITANRPDRDAKINRRVIKMVAAILIAFYICFLSYWIGWVFCSYCYSKLICNETYIFISIFLCYANSSLNPVIYCAFSENFRLAFKVVVKQTCPCFTNSSSRRRRVTPLISAVVFNRLSLNSLERNQGDTRVRESIKEENEIGSGNRKVLTTEL